MAAQSERMEASTLFNPAEFAAFGKNYVEELNTAQTELFGKLQDINRHWLERINSEANLASKFASEFAAAKSIPEAVSAYQEWTKRRFEMMAEDGQHLMADAQKFATTSARLFANPWQPKSPSVST